jgi:hypothetical protein
MSRKNRKDSHPWWAKIILFVVGLIDLILAGMIRNIGFINPPEGINTTAAFIILGQVSGLLIGGVIFLFYRGSQSYAPSGSAIDRSHIWVNAKSGKKVSNATIKNVYEKQHGYGSWKKKVKSERGCLGVVAIIAGVGLSVIGLIYLSSVVKFPLLLSFRSLVGSGLKYWLAWFGLALLGGVSLFFLYLAFWDVMTYNTSFNISPSGRPMGLQNEPPSIWIILPKALLLLINVLLIIFILLFTFIPSIRASSIGGQYRNALFLTYTVSGLLWLSSIFLQSIRTKKDHQTELTYEEKREGLEKAVKTFFGKESSEKERLISALILLGNRANLTEEGRKGIVDVLKMISAEDFGKDYPRWEEWIMKRIMTLSK